MENKTLHLLMSSAGTVAAWLFGDWNTPLLILLVVILLDFVSGLLKAIKEKKLSSELGKDGLLKKSSIIIVLILAVMLDRLLETDSWVCRTAVTYFYIANEGISVLENCAGLGLPVPKKIINVLDQLNDEGRNKNE